MRSHLTASLLALAACVPAAVRAQDQTEAVRILDAPMLFLIGTVEGPMGYNAVTHFKTHNPPKPITELTINQVLRYQEELRARGAASSAVGKYQFIYKTLKWMIDTDDDLHGELIFDGHVQDRLARRIMLKCEFYNPGAEIFQIGDCLADAWAALPVLTGATRGRSRYEDTKINKALVRPEVMEAVLKTRITAAPPVRDPIAEAPKRAGVRLERGSFWLLE